MIGCATDALAKMKKYCSATLSDMSFSGLTTFGCGGKIKSVVYPRNVKGLVACIRIATQSGMPFVVLGNGSNVLASDEYFDGVVIVTKKICGITVKKNKVRAECGTSSAKLSSVLADNGFTGGEFLGCIPGTIGGAVVTNAGCYGQRTSSIVSSVEILQNDEIRRLSADKCSFSHRKSVFCSCNAIILAVNLQLEKGEKELCRKLAAGMMRRKKQSQPLGQRSAGSVFYHDKLPVSKYVDKLGLKGFRIGGAAVSDKHAGFIVNVNNAKSADVIAVMKHVKKSLVNAYGIVPQTEVRLVNFDESSISDL